MREDKVSSLQSTGPQTEDLQFKMFSILWAIATLFHMAHSSVFDSQLNLALLTVAAFWVIFRPSFIGFLFLITLQIFDAVFRMPVTTNHWIFTAFVNMTLLHVLIFMMISNQSFRVSQGGFYNSFSALVRLEVIILYFFAVFHKLNSGFFTPGTSCATDLLRAQNIDQIIPLNDTTFMVNAYFTLVVECSIPLLLCFKSTRNAGVCMGLIFHCILSYSTFNAFYDFSSLMFALYFLFLGPEFSNRLQRIAQHTRDAIRRTPKTFSTARLVMLCTAIFLLLAILYVLNKKLDTFRSVHLYFFWTFYSILFTGAFIWYLFSRRNRIVTEYPMGMRHWSLLLIPLVVFINGTMPYLGLKTENSYAMFSNLRTEGGYSNHFIIPAKAQIFGFQKDVVEIISSTDPWLQELAEQRQAMVLFEFQNYVNDRKPDRVDYTMNGQRKTFLKTAEESYSALGQNPYVLRKLMKFRSFSLEGPQPCAH